MKLAASKSKSAPDSPTIRLASDVTPAAIVTTAVARRCGTSSFCAIIQLLLGPHAANLLERTGLAGFTFLRDASARTSHAAASLGHLVLSNIQQGAHRVTLVADGDPRTGATSSSA